MTLTFEHLNWFSMSFPIELLYKDENTTQRDRQNNRKIIARLRMGYAYRCGIKRVNKRVGTEITSTLL